MAEEFFKEIEHVEMTWGERSIWVPIFYRDNMSIGALFAAPQEKLRALLPSKRMHPIRNSPGNGVLSVLGMEFRDSDLAPYNEFSISIPFTLDKPTPVFTGTLRKEPKEPYLCITCRTPLARVHMPSQCETAGCCARRWSSASGR